MGIMSSEMQRLLTTSICILLMVCFKVVGAEQNVCGESMCGDNQGLAIHFPLLRRHHCGNPGVQCNGRNETVLEQPIVLAKFFVKRIDYKYQEIQAYSPDNCMLLKPVEIQNMPISPFSLTVDSYRRNNFTLFDCPTPPIVTDINFPVPCLGDPGHKVYAIFSSFGLDMPFRELQFCRKMYDVLSVPFNYLADDSDLRFKWSTPNCTQCEAMGKRCRLKNNGTKTGIECVHLKKASKDNINLCFTYSALIFTDSKVMHICIHAPCCLHTQELRRYESQRMKFVATGATLGSFVLLLLVIAVYCVYNSDRKEKENQLRIERFLEDYKALKPSRYSYADIKRITNQFKEKLGQGAYGTVFKGKLSSEFFVAVKLLNSSKGNGEEFVNEVGTQCHIHHVNVVRLIGFCADGFRRALVYEFFPNGSLQDFISSADSKTGFLGWDKLQDISIGIAKGIEYLHQGCDQRILHFDIKPHNILLDQNFTPKIADFGLAKLCSKDQSIVSMTTARGTMGYIAPEVFSRNFGNVSYKSDVYSFGMLLLEVVGGRKNIGETMDNTSEVYYPEWIYNLLEEGEDTRIHIGEEANANIQKKLSIVGLWCIQWHPVDRPSMKIVVQMLEGRKNLTLPPNPFVSTNTNASRPARRLNLELEAIAELE